MYVARPAWRWRSTWALRLGADLGDQLGHDVDVEGHQIVDPNPLHGPEDPVSHAVGGVVAGPAEPKGDGPGGILGELARWHQPGSPRGHAEHEGARPADQGAVEIEERCARARRG